MSSYEDRLKHLERRVRSLETGIRQDLELIATSAQTASPGRGAMTRPPPNEAQCWTCSSALVVETWDAVRGAAIGEGEGKYVSRSICRVYAGAVDGMWHEPGAKPRVGDEIVHCYSYQVVPSSGT